MNQHRPLRKRGNIYGINLESTVPVRLRVPRGALP
jgi:hypothetical protein